MPDFPIQKCPTTVNNVINHIRETSISAARFSLQSKFCEVADCLIIKQYSYTDAIDINNEHDIPQYWHKMRFKSKDDYIMFVLKWT